MEVQIKDGKLIIAIDLQEPTPSISGKTLVVASTKELILGLNAYIKK